MSTSNINLSVFASREAQAAVLEHGVFEGQEVDLHPKSKSMLELAYEMDDCPTDAALVRDKIIKRDIKDKKKSTEKRKILALRISKLDKNHNPRAYEEYERKFNRLKQQAMLQNPQFREGESSEQLTYEGEPFSDYVLRNLPMDFPEVTEQDNVLEYLLLLEDFEASSNGEEISQCEKMIKRLAGQPDAKSQQRIEEFSQKIHSLQEQIQFSTFARRSIGEALQDLRKIHGQEIKDGYNIIPKAASLLGGAFTIGGKQLSPVDIAAIYRDNILGCENFLEAFSVIISICYDNSTKPTVALSAQ
ncbi:MAG: hypothetical protein LBC68_01125 [Prevotellaceae bacterium]|jgi:hypothetical protein|nr:hypothetical protein [Prevotellaceae bacterium]